MRDSAGASKFLPSWLLDRSVERGGRDIKGAAADAKHCLDSVATATMRPESAEG